MAFLRGGPPGGFGGGGFLPSALAGVGFGLGCGGLSSFLGAALGELGFSGCVLLALFAFAFVCLRPGLGCAAFLCGDALGGFGGGGFLPLALAGVGFGLGCGGPSFFLGSPLGELGFSGCVLLALLAFAFLRRGFLGRGARCIGSGCFLELALEGFGIGACCCSFPLCVPSLVVQAFRLCRRDLVARDPIVPGRCDGGDCRERCRLPVWGENAHAVARRLHEAGRGERMRFRGPALLREHPVLDLLLDRDPGKGAKRIRHVRIDRASNRHCPSEPVELAVLDRLVNELPILVGTLTQHRDAEPLDELEALLWIEVGIVNDGRGPGCPRDEETVPEPRRRSGLRRTPDQVVRADVEPVLHQLERASRAAVAQQSFRGVGGRDDDGRIVDRGVVGGLSASEPSELGCRLLADEHLHDGVQLGQARGALAVDNEQARIGVPEAQLEVVVRYRPLARDDHDAGLERAEQDRRPGRARIEKHDNSVAGRQLARSQEGRPPGRSTCDIVEGALVDHALGVDEPERSTLGVGRARLDHVPREVERLWRVRTTNLVRSRPAYVPAADKPSHWSR